MFFLPNKCLRWSLLLYIDNSDLFLSQFCHFCVKDRACCRCSPAPSFSSLESYWADATQQLHQHFAPFTNTFDLCLLLTSWPWLGYRLNHYHLFCFSSDAWRFSSTLPSCKGSLVMHSSSSLGGLGLLIYGHWLACHVHIACTEATVWISSVLLRCCLCSDPLALIEDKGM